MINIKKIIPYYWIVFTIYAFFRMRYGIFTRIDTIYEVCILICAFCGIRSLKWGLIDKLIALFIIYSLFSCFSRGISYESVSGWFRSILFGSCGYYIAKSGQQNRYRLFEMMKYIFPAICLIALFLYFHPTPWYLNYKLNYSGLSDHTIIELSRLSGFWEFPYFISYGSFIYLAYFSLKNFKQKAPIDKYMYLFFVIVVLTCFFAQQRVAIVFIFGLYVLFHVLLMKKGHTIKNLIVCDIFVILFLSSSLVLLKSVVSLDTYDYIVERMFENTAEKELITDRFDMFESESEINDIFFGEGYGSHGRDSKEVISDNQFLNIYSDLGIVGLVLLYTPIVLSLLKKIRTYKNYMFEFCVILFYLAAMTGANPINSLDLHPFIFWYCLGLLNNKYGQLQIL